MSNPKRQDAQKLVARLRRLNGGVSDRARQNNDETVVELREALDSLREQVAASAERLSRELYAKDTRFIYELIQNADDNAYTLARKTNTKPELTFTLLPGRIIVDSNEDGFTEENVTAICKIGKSTKSRSANDNQGFIGEKGIGFKSVFKIAKRVFVKSEPYSFSFHYVPHAIASGLGMITPISEDYDDMPSKGTRILLTEIEETSFEELQMEFERIPNTLLFFLKSLEVLVIKQQFGDRTRETRYSRTSTTPNSFQEINVMQVEYSAQNDAHVFEETRSTTSSRFYVVEKKVDNLSRDEARKTAEGEYITSSTVVLAFPVSNNDEPKIEEQFVYAFLPLRKAGFPFLLQADFIVPSTREDVQYSSQRNRSLLSAVADLFCDTVETFSQFSGTFRYTWLKYLPPTSIRDEFWKDLYPQIANRLSSQCVVRSWTNGDLHLPSDLLRLPSSMRDEDNRPLLQDFDSVRYLSPNYEESDSLRLWKLGTKTVHDTEFLELLKHDIKGPASRWKQLEMSPQWQKKVAQILLKMCDTSQSDSKRDELKGALQGLHLVPVIGAGWYMPRAGNLLMPTIASMSIPTDLGLRLIRPASLAVPERKQLLQALGVKNAVPRDIVQGIYNRYLDDTLPTASIEDSVTHFKFLFHHASRAHHRESGSSRQTQSGAEVLPPQMKLLEQNVSYVPRGEPLYFKDSDITLGSGNLFMKDDKDQNQDPGLNVQFLHEDYILAVSLDNRSSDPSWIKWLEQAVSVRHSPRLTTWMTVSGNIIGRSTLSPEFEYILKWKPSLFIYVLEYYQHEYFPLPAEIVGKLSDAQVPVGNGLKLALKKTCLRTEKLNRITKELEIPDTCPMPFLNLASVIAEDRVASFKFLGQLGVVTDATFDFYLRALVALIDWAGEDEDESETTQQVALPTTQVVCRVYSEIARVFSQENRGESLQTRRCVFIPEVDESPSWGWEWIGNCVWSGPSWLESKCVLVNIEPYRQLEFFFTSVLQVRNIRWDDFIKELLYMKLGDQRDMRKTANIYDRLWQDFRGDSQHSVLREQFETHELILTANGTWAKPSSCLWASDKVRIAEKACISHLYNPLEKFFRECLQVPEPDLQMHVQALKDLAKSREASMSALKEAMIHLSHFNPAPDSLKSDFASTSIFPVKLLSGHTQRSMPTVDFAIVDRVRYNGLFDNRIKILDFSLHDVRLMQPFLEACGLRKQFMSVRVEEKTSVTGQAFDSLLTERMRSNAYAFVRCAVHYQSPRISDGIETLQKELQQLSIYRSDEISQSLTIQQYPDTVTIPQDKAKLHFEYNGGLHIYVPRDTRAFRLCIQQQLPLKFKSWLDISDPIAQANIGHIIESGDDLLLLDEVLDEAGIIHVDGVVRPEQPERGTEDVRGASGESVRVTVEAEEPSRGDYGCEVLSSDEDEIDTPAASTETEAGIIAENSAQRHTPSIRVDLGHSRSVSDSGRPAHPREPSTRSVSEVVDRHVDDASATSSGSTLAFVSVLDDTIRAAQRTSIPEKSRLPSFALRSTESVIRSRESNVLAFGPTIIHGIRNRDRDCRVGVAGELYIYEMLRSILPDLEYSHWKSSIRHQVSIHERYQDLSHWPGRETSDLVYPDTQSLLTNTFIEKGYLEKDIWQDETPEYQIEVKTTTGQWSEPFYMSKSQYSRMERLRLHSGEPSSVVYIIMRVFSLGYNDVGFVVYVDPCSAKERGDLCFSSDKWAVEPRII